MRLIDADAVRQKREDFAVTSNPEMNRFNRMFVDLFNREIDKAPTIDAVPVVHGKWISVKNPQWPAYSHDKCSICGWLNTKNSVCRDEKNKAHSLNFCPNCGADMRGEDNGQ